MAENKNEVLEMGKTAFSLFCLKIKSKTNPKSVMFKKNFMLFLSHNQNPFFLLRLSIL